MKVKHKKNKSYTTNLLDVLRNNNKINSGTKIPTLSSRQSNSTSNSHSNEN